MLPWYKLSRSRGLIYIDLPSCRSYPGGGYIDKDDIHTWENNVLGEGVYRPPPLVLKLSGGGISATAYPIKNKKTKEEIKRGEEERNRREAIEEEKEEKKEKKKGIEGEKKKIE